MFIEFSRRVLTAPGRWSVAGQTFALQVLIAVLVVAAGLAGAYGQAQRAGDQEAIARALAVAETMAATPDVVAGVQGPDPSTVLQPYAERVRVESGTDFVVVMSRDAIRYTHPDPTQIGKKFLGHTEDALAGGVVEEDYTGTLGPSSRVVVPVTDRGKVVALVSVGIRKSAVGKRVRAQLPGLLLAGLVAALLATTRGHDANTLRVTITQRGTTVHETVTQPATPPPKTPTASATSAAADGFTKMRAGDYPGALPLLRQAAQSLNGSGSLAEAYNDYNLAFTLAKTQGCSTEVLQLLDASQRIQGHRKPIDDLRHACNKALR